MPTHQAYIVLSVCHAIATCQWHLEIKSQWDQQLYYLEYIGIDTNAQIMHQAGHHVNKLQKLFVIYVRLIFWIMRKHMMFCFNSFQLSVVSKMSLNRCNSGATRPTAET